MNRRHVWASAVVLVAIPVVCLYAACGDDRPGPGGGSVAGYGSSGQSSGGTGSSGSSSGSSGSSTEPGPQVCEGTLQRGEEVPEGARPGAAPEPLGGAIEPGTYVLVEVTAYGAAEPPPSDEPDNIPPTGVKTKKTLFVVGNLMRTIGSRSVAGGALPPETAEAWTFSATGTALDTKAVCPTKATSVKQVPYSAVGNALALFVDATHREVYERR